MLTLILDTSTDYSLLALTKDSELLAEYPLPVGQQSLVLLPSIEGFIKCHGFKISDLEQIAIGIGPGAFTGTRIGVMIAKTLGYALNIPLLPFCSLMALPPKPGAFTSITDAKAGQIYALQGYHSPEKTTYETPTLHQLNEFSPTTPLISPHATNLLNIKDLQWNIAYPNAQHTTNILSQLKPTSAQKVEVLYLRSP